MHDKTNLLRVGTKVEVGLDLIRDQVPFKVTNLIANNPSCIVVDYKMTDGMGIGYIVQFSDGSRYWFFANEIIYFDSEYQSIEQLNSKNSLISYSDNSDLAENDNRDSYFNAFNNRGNEILYCLNPLNFIRWYIYATKDIL